MIKPIIRRVKIAAFSLGFLVINSAYADAPVAAAVPSGSGATAVDTSSMSLEQRVALLERQMSALNQINLSQQVNDLQQQLQEVQGQVEVLTHNLQTLQTQSTSQYADIDQRLHKRESGGSSAAATADNPADNTSGGSSDAATGDQQASTVMVQQKAYQAAYDKVKNHDYPAAIAAMHDFLAKYPESQYASNAHYWLGQMYLLQGDGKNAEKEFKIILTQYPQDTKAADASLKLGFTYILQNNLPQARQQFKKVMKNYPGTSAAQIAQARLAQLP